MKHEFYYPSRDGVTKIHATEWIPEGEIEAVLQISHGMVEYIDRYDEFATFLSQKGIYVVGQDHLGHGKSVQTEDMLGYFHSTHGNQFVVGDIHKLREMTMEKHPGKPYFLLGHSMGSFLTRQYLCMYGKGIDGAIIMGTGSQPAALLHVGRALCRVIGLFKGDHYRSELVNQMAFGSYNKAFQPVKTRADWVTSDPGKLEAYVQDPLCSFVFTVNAYYHMFGGMLQLTKKENLMNIPKDLPVLVTSGADDPVGAFGKGPKKVYDKYKTAGIKDVSLKLYPGDRHEILNETDRQMVYQDLLVWLESKILSKKL